MSAQANAREAADSTLLELLRRHAEPLPHIDTPMFGALFDRYANAKVVLIGESSHGTQEFYRTRAAITRHLIERHGFNIVAVEADWPDAGQLDRKVRGIDPMPVQDPAFGRFPSWMWRNAEVSEFITWLRGHNHTLPLAERTEFRGLDIYSLRNSMAQVLSYLDRTDPALAHQARQRYGCLTPWQDDPALYGHFVERAGQAPCEDAVVQQLNSLLAKRLADDGEAFSALPRTPGWCVPPSSITAPCIVAGRRRGTCGTSTCSTRSRPCSPIGAPRPRPWSGRTIPISAMLPPR